ncbi:hypothetical protein DAPPUDRAFT_246354 [Daphnia pulex]|uniref:Uncharacterized protein n=1 Tax=Daphnia pulex TaxID=6669 RepID=E9GQ98_DAPPU|nr:hypothetical protein DAPPUDRAFT_246354 [Daphnia pulex]|eukprot:EFX78379.1 hypothetical protein DAPPUDRAFT_246354 [Daphnia pulex]
MKRHQQRIIILMKNETEANKSAACSSRENHNKWTSDWQHFFFSSVSEFTLLKTEDDFPVMLEL